MGKTPKKDINLYPLVVAPKKNTMKKGALYVVLGAAAVVLLAGGFVGTKIYKDTQSKLVTEMKQKADDSDLREKIKNADAVAADIAVERTAGNAYTELRKQIDSSWYYNDDFTTDLVDQLKSCETAQNETIASITGLSFDGTVLHITAESISSQSVSAFVKNLRNLDAFSDVSYSGYTLTDGVYTYEVLATFVEHVYTETPTDVTTEVTP